ncbi:MAG TPA: TonB family protein [Terriglobales bacterium]|nr:TonB family protein [Terriglobales bacterium]
MAFKSLLLSKDADLVQTLTRLLKDLDVSVEPCSEPFAAAKRLMDQHFDAILVDCEDEQGAGWVLQSARMATGSKKSITIAIVGPQSASRGGPRAGENFVIQKPIVLKQVESTLRAARGLMGDAGSPHSEVPAARSMPAEKPLSPPSAPQTHALHTAQGRPPAEMFDELTAALDRLGPQPASAKPVSVASASSGSAAAAAPALEKPVPLAPAFEKPAPAVPAWEKPVAASPAWEKPTSVAPEPAPREEPVAPPVLRPTQPSWPGLTATPSAPPKSEAPAVLPLAATAAQMKPPIRPAEEQARSNDALENVRRRMNASAPPAWRTEVDERPEAPAPRFSTYADDERPQRGFPFKAIAVAMVLVSFALFGYSWYRGRHTNTPGDQPQTPTSMPQQQRGETPSSALPSSAPISPSSGQADSSTEIAGGSAADIAPAIPVTSSPKPSKSVAAKAAETTAPDSTTDLEMPPAPLVVEGGKRHSNPGPQTDAQLAPPSLDTVAGTAKPGLGGVVSSAKVNVPKLAATPPPPPQRIEVSQGVTQGLLIRQVKPQYPPMARETRVEGDVVLSAVIDKAGAVSDVRAISGPALLIPPALQAVRQWRYKPYLLNGQPVEVETQIKVQFRL